MKPIPQLLLLRWLNSRGDNLEDRIEIATAQLNDAHVVELDRQYWRVSALAWEVMNKWQR